MGGNAHAHRHRVNRKPCPAYCMYCASRPKFGDYKNKNGHRHNPASSTKQKRAKR